MIGRERKRERRTKENEGCVKEENGERKERKEGKDEKRRRGLGWELDGGQHGVEGIDKTRRR